MKSGRKGIAKTSVAAEVRHSDRAMWLLYALVVLAPVVFWPSAFAPTDFKLPVITLICGALVAVTLIRISLDANWRLPITPLLYPALAIIAWKLISAAYGSRFYVSCGLLITAIIYLVAFLGVTAFVRRTEQAIRLLKVACLAAIPVAVIGAGEHFGLRLPGLRDNGMGRIYSTLGNPTYLAAYLALLLPAQMCFCCVVARTEERLAFAFASLLSFSCIIWTYTRGSWLGVLVALPVLALFVLASPARQAISAKRVIMLALSFAVVGVCCLATRPALQIQPQSDGAHIGMRSDDSIRTAFWKAGWQMFKESPVLGQGLGGFVATQLEYIPAKPIPGAYDMGEDFAHNEVIQVAAEEGLPGLAVFLWTATAMIVAGWAGLKRFRAEGDADAALALAGVMAGLAAFTGDLLTNVAIHQVYVGVIVWVFAGLLAVLSAKGREVEVNPPRRRPITQRLSLIAAGLFISCGLVWIGVTQFVSSIQTAKATDAVKQQDFEKAISGYQAALRSWPYSSTPLYNLGVCYLQGAYYNDAQATLDRYNSRYPHGNRVDYYLGLTYFRRGDYRRAVEYSEVAARRDPTSVDELRLLAAAHYMEGDREKALRLSSKAVAVGADSQAAGLREVKPVRASSGLAANYIAEELLRAGLYEEAVAPLVEATKKEPRNSAFLTLLGSVYWQLRQLPKAEAALRAAIRADDASVDAHGYLASVCLQSGRKAEARAELEKAISLHPNAARLATFRQMLQQTE